MQWPGASACATRAGEIDGRFEQLPVRRTPRAMMGDARGEFCVVGEARGGDVGDGQRAVARELFGMHALARAGAAENEGEVAGNHRVIVPVRPGAMG